MVKCDYCDKLVDDIFPHKCKFCGQVHCHNHLQPENHDCIGLEAYKNRNQAKWKKAFRDINQKNYKRYDNNSKNIEESGKKEKNIQKLHDKQKIKYKLGNYFLDKLDNLVHWLRKRDHHRYNYEKRMNYLITTALIFIASIVGLSIFYSNAVKLNEINLWIINLGGTLILTSLFFTIKLGLRLGKEGINILKRQRNWLKYLIIILIVFILWQAYTNKDTILNPVFDTYNKTNFSLFSPISFESLSLDSTSSDSSNVYSNQKKDDSRFGSFVNGILNPKSQIGISELEQRVHILINEERINYGLKPLIWDDKIALIAREHSQDMAINDFFSHDNPDGEDPTDRGNRHGYSCRKDYGSYYTYGLAENIALTPIYSNVVDCGSTTSLDNLAGCIVDGWMTSPGHRENILTSTYTKTGVGIAYSNNDEAYSTQNFC